MLCPVCKKQMMILEYKEVEVDYCPNCEGVWLDQGELELLLETDDAHIDLSDAGGFEKGQRLCPRCRKKMVKGSFPGTEVEVDICPRDNGLWLDKGELYDITHIHSNSTIAQQTRAFFSDLFDNQTEQEEE